MVGKVLFAIERALKKKFGKIIFKKKIKFLKISLKRKYMLHERSVILDVHVMVRITTACNI